MNPRLLFIHALSPIHAGTGQSVGAIDLAIARDRATNHPYIPGSSIKGVLRDRAKQVSPDDAIAIFGPETANAGDHSGAVIVGDANLLLLPVRSVAGTFAYVTSPFLLHRFLRDCTESGLQNLPTVPTPTDVNNGYVGGGAKVRVTSGNAHRVILEDLDVTANVDNKVDAISTFLGQALFKGQNNEPWRTGLAQRMVVVHDDVMSFLSEHATDVVARICLNSDTKTVKKGALWYEESLPTETVLVSVVGAMGNGKATEANVFERLTHLTTRPLQLGGKATVGRGRCRAVLHGGAK